MQNQELVSETTLKGLEELKRRADSEGVSLLEYIRKCRANLKQTKPEGLDVSV